MRRIDEETIAKMEQAVQGVEYLEKAQMPVSLWDADRKTLMAEIVHQQAEILRRSLVISGCMRRLAELDK